jgi:hypothetical protein
MVESGHALLRMMRGLGGVAVGGVAPFLAALGLILALPSAGLHGVVAQDTVPAKATPAAGSPCQDVLQIDESARIATLLADCVTNSTVGLAGGWTLDGDSHTIFARDPASGRLTGGVVVTEGDSATIHNLTVDGSGLTEPCLRDDGATNLGGIVFRQAAGRVDGVTVRNVSRILEPSDALTVGDRKSCGSGIVVFGNQTPVVVTESAIENVGYVGVLIEAGRVSLANNTVAGAGLAGVLATDGNVRVWSGNSISESENGIWLEGAGSDGRIAGNTLSAIAGAGVSLIQGASGTVVDNTITDAGFGIWVLDRGSTATVETNSVADVGRTGILIERGGSATVRENRIARGTAGLAVVGAGSTADLTGNTIADMSLAGIVIEGGAAANVTANTLTRPGTHGIRIDDAGTNAVITGNAAAGALENGITVRWESTAKIAGNTIKAESETPPSSATESTPETTGIAASERARVTIAAGNRIDGMAQGILIFDEGTTAEITGTRVEGAARVGIAVVQGAQAPRVENNTVVDSAFGLTAIGAGTAATFADNRVVGITNIGFTVQEGAEATLSRNRVAGARSGISVMGAGSTATVEENVAFALRGRGFSVESGAAATLRRNRVLAADIGFVVTVAGSTADLSGNTAIGMRGAGLIVETGSSAAAHETRLLLPGEVGILVQGEATTADISESLISGALVSGIIIRDGAHAALGPGTRVSASFWNAPLVKRRTTMTFDGGFGPHPDLADAMMLRVARSIDHLGFFGILIEQGATAEMTGVAIEDVAHAGILVQRGARATIANSQVSGATQIGILATKGADVVLSDGVLIDGPERGLIVLAPETTVEATGIRIENAGAFGLAVLDGAALDATDVAVEGGMYGIIIGVDSRATIAESAVADIRHSAITDAGGAEVQLRGNRIDRAGFGVVVYGAGTTATVEDTTFTEVAPPGIIADPQADVTEMGAVTEDAVNAPAADSRS